MISIADKTFTNPDYNSYFENYPYELSDFQKHAIQTIVDGNHVLVTAHTGSGKTLPAEFAIKHFVGKGKKVIYTSPIKALSNQKYYDFTHKYPDITFGLLTGDIKTNPNADVLIMTTEILLNKLFRMNDATANASTANASTATNATTRLTFDMDIERDLAAVVFDECHYINDNHRGHVWEQCIMMLPKQVQMILLSATIDDPSRFAKLVVGTGDKSLTICSTNHRVVPLTHYMFVTSNEGLHKKINDKSVSAGLRRSMNTCLTIQDADGAFNVKTYSEVSNMLKLMEKHRVYPSNQFVLNSLIEHLKGPEGSEGPSMLPAIIFVFSRRLVEQYAEEITVPLFDDRDPTIIDIPYHKIRHECMSVIRRLPNWQEYAALPEYISLVNLLEKGIGIHHSGMLPVLREIVELMISKKYIRVLFATESFAIGLDCPIKTAVFVNLKKFDSGCSGNADRYLMAHEYTQMAGRAGRRGIDTVGNVVHCVNMFPASSFPIQSTYKEILSGIPQRLISKFKIDYKMVLNILALQLHNPSDNPSDNCESKQFCDFIKGSMMSMELDKMESGILTEIADLETKISLFEFKFSIEDVKEYWKLQKLREMASNKKLKEIERDSKKMVDKCPGIVADYAAFCKLKDLESSLSDKRNSIESLSSFIENSIGQIMGVLLKKGIVEIAESMQLTKKGEICTSIAEVNPILMCELLEHFNDFEGVDPPTLASFLSVFADVRCRNADSYEQPENEMFKQFMFVCDSIVECEDANGIRETLNTNDFSFAIADEVFEWCQCADENDCHVVLQGLRDEKGVSIGDFTKAMLKISTVVRELISVCEKTGKVELMSRLSQIDPLILKHVTTNQSLYL